MRGRGPGQRDDHRALGVVTPVPRLVRAAAPVRICDLGGWTDTWFAGHGLVCNVAVTPGAEVHVVTHPRGRLASRIVLELEQSGDRYGLEPSHGQPGRHPLLEAAIARSALPESHDFEITIRSPLPAGSSLGTSAAVLVTLVGALDALTPERLTPSQVAAAAHQIETDDLGLQSGVQDQLAAAYGGINLIEIDSYPRARVHKVQVTERVRHALQDRLLLVYLGRPHVSSAVHEQVIAELRRDSDASRRLEPLRDAARAGAAALEAGDLEAYGSALIENTHAQTRLHPALVGPDAKEVIEIARRRGAAAWKVNGAGGPGGSVSVLGQSDPAGRARLAMALQRADRAWHIFPTRIDTRGLRVETSLA